MRFCEHGTDPSGSMKLGNFYLLKDCYFFKKTLPHWVINKIMPCFGNGIVRSSGVLDVVDTNSEMLL